MLGPGIWSKLLSKGDHIYIYIYIYRDYMGSFLKGYEALHEERWPWLTWFGGRSS